jgi:hypothetical protein
MSELKIDQCFKFQTLPGLVLNLLGILHQQEKQNMEWKLYWQKEREIQHLFILCPLEGETTQA